MKKRNRPSESAEQGNVTEVKGFFGTCEFCRNFQLEKAIASIDNVLLKQYETKLSYDFDGRKTRRREELQNSNLKGK